MTARSLTAWHARLVEAVEQGVTPRTSSNHLGQAFKHDRAVGGDRAFATRRFGLAVEGALPRGTSRPGGTWLRLSCLLRVDYLDMPQDQATVNLAMLEDAADIVDVLCTSEQWRWDDTFIRVVGGQTPTDIAAIEFVPVQGGQRLQIRFPVEVHR